MAFARKQGGALAGGAIGGRRAAPYGKGIIAAASKIPPMTEEFYEIEPALVMDICTEDHPNFNAIGGYGMIGSVKFKMLYSNQATNSDQLGWALPLSSNLREYPLVGELVCTFNERSRKGKGYR